uniref:Uncharacterized protein n=1 Tax=Cucumis melo TaxID=3656 RepID=A0A9I9DFQ2_CUCME
MKEEEIEKANLEERGEMGNYLRVNASPGLREEKWKNKGERQGGICGVGLAFGFVGCSSVLAFR